LPTALVQQSGYGAWKRPMSATAVSLFPIFLVLLVAAGALWVYQDASAHEKRGKPVYFSAGSLEINAPTVWAVGCLVLCVVFVPLYITCRRTAD
jgi:hypothetical protein